jgi:hypothetical protein
LQMYDERYRADGADACVALFLEKAKDEVTVITFCVTFLEHNNLRRATTEALLELAFELLGRTGDRGLFDALKAVRRVKRTRTASTAREVLARTAAEPGTDLRLGAGMVVRVPSAAYEVALGETRHGIMATMTFVGLHGAQALICTRLPGIDGYVPGPAVKALQDGSLGGSVFAYLLLYWPKVLPIPASVLPVIVDALGQLDARGLSASHTHGSRVFAAMIEAASADPCPELSRRLMERCPGPDEMQPIRDLLEGWGRGEVAFVDPAR